MLKLDHRDSRTLFAVGFAAVILCFLVPFIPAWRTFIHMWQAELVASVFLLVALSFLIFRTKGGSVGLSIDPREFRFIVLPIAAFIVWSGISIFWAPSWKSALHHTLVWTEYLVFYLIIRSVIDRDKGYGKILLVLTAAFVLVSLPALFEYSALLMFGGGTSIGLRYARYGEQVNTLIPLVLAGIMGLAGKRFAAGVAAAAALWLLIFVSLGRTNIALFACGTAAVGCSVFIFKRFHGYRLKMVVIVLVMIAAPLPLHLLSLFSSDPNIPVLRRVNNESGISSSNGFRKLMASISLEMLSQNPVTGVGADNFGMQLNRYRADYAIKNPTDPNLVNAEDEIPERSHNEYLQILAELGVVGGLIIVWLLCGVAVMVFEALRHRQTSLSGLAAISGVLIFLASSLVTSYSFRLIQNGFVFFFVLAAAARFMFSSKKAGASSRRIVLSPLQVRIGAAFGIIACVCLMTYCSLRVASVIYATRADTTQDLDDASKLYRRAFSLDNENPDAEFSFAFRLMQAKRFGEAAEHFKRSIEIGRAPSVNYSYLSTSYLMSGNPQQAVTSFSNALTMYPLSPFVRTRYAFLLEQNGESSRSAAELKEASRLSAADAATWWTLMKNGALRASENANRDKNISPVMDLVPAVAIYAILAERVIEHPEEKSTIEFMK